MSRLGLATAAQLVEPSARRRWILQILFALLVSLTEAVGALLILFLLTNITQTGQALSLPIVGDLRQRFPRTDERILFAWVAAFIAAFFLARAVLVVAQSYLQNRLVYDTGASLASRLFRIYLDHDLQWHVRRNSSELIRNTNDSVTQIVGNVFIPFVAVASDSLLTIGILAVLLVKAPIVSLLAMAILGTLVIGLLRVVQPRYTVVGRINAETTREGIELVQQGVGAIRDIKVLGVEEHFAKRFRDNRRRQARAWTIRQVLLDLPRPVVETTVILLILAFLTVERTTSGSEGSSLAILGLFAYAILRIMPAINRTVANIGVMRFGGAAVDIVLADLREAAGPPSVRVPVEPLLLHDAIALEDVSIRYPDGAQALDGISLRIRAGMSVGVVGPTGCGKTTLIDVMTGLLQPDSGRLTLDGIDLDKTVASWQASIGLVPQMTFLVDDTLRSNIALGVAPADIDEEALSEAARLSQLRDFIDGLTKGLDTVVGEHGARLSGGQRQRVAIARALYRQPAVLFFDEGTSALDNLTEAELVREIDLLRGERTIVTVAHRLSTVRNCDMIVLMDAGRIVDSGTWADLMARSAGFQRFVAEKV